MAKKLKEEVLGRMKDEGGRMKENKEMTVS